MGLIKWFKNTFYTTIFFGVIGASLVCELNTISDAYRKNLENKIEVFEEYKNKKNLETGVSKFFKNEYNYLKEKYQKFKENSTYRILEMITHPHDTYKAYKKYGKFDFGKLFTKDSLVGFEIGALGGLALRTYMAARKLSRKRKK